MYIIHKDGKPTFYVDSLLMLLTKIVSKDMYSHDRYHDLLIGAMLNSKIGKSPILTSDEYEVTLLKEGCIKTHNEHLIDELTDSIPNGISFNKETELILPDVYYQKSTCGKYIRVFNTLKVSQNG